MCFMLKKKQLSVPSVTSNSKQTKWVVVNTVDVKYKRDVIKLLADRYKHALKYEWAQAIQYATFTSQLFWKDNATPEF